MKPPQDNSKTQRLFEIVRLLQLGSYTTRALAERTGWLEAGDADERRVRAAQRNIQRDLLELKRYGINVVSDPRNRHQKTIHQPGRDGLPPLEALALYAATRMLFHHAPNRTYRAALSRLTAFIPTRVRELVKGSISDVEHRSREDKALEKAALAWFGGHTLRFKYKSANSRSGEWRENTLQVYFIEIHRSNLGVYVIGKETGFHHKIRTFKASRMKDPQIIETSQPYEIPDDFNPLEYLDGAMGVVGRSDGQLISIALCFSPEVRERILENDHVNLSIIRDHPDGRLEAKLDVGVDTSGLPREALAWIHSWGPRVEVIGPAPVRAKWLEDTGELLRRYGGINS
jgi:predicted DNA-binding transcriptional regulator YafY